MTEQPTRCPECGRALRNGQRVGGKAGAVLVCLDPRTGDGCGHETPPLYRRRKPHRDWNYDYLPLRGGGQQREMPTDGR